MERLQTAIGKARRARAGLAPIALATHALPRRRPATLPPGQPGPGPLAPATDPWDALAPYTPDPALLARNRVVTLAPGPLAAPYDLLRTRILQETARHGWRRIALVSPHDGAGRTTLAANLALAFARQHDRRLLLLDLDFRSPGLARTLGITPETSLADVLDGTVPFADHARRLGKSLAIGLATGTLHLAAERLQSTTTADTIARLEAAYAPDITLVDLPSLDHADHAIAFLKTTDAAILVAEQDKTKTTQIDDAERIVANTTNVLGTVITKARG